MELQVEERQLRGWETCSSSDQDGQITRRATIYCWNLWEYASVDKFFFLWFWSWNFRSSSLEIDLQKKQKSVHEEYSMF